ncbi:MAG: hypothetical protein M1570_02435 [Chloroflexi bacterium]|nr:hypothetical protein [Chloroflexota bacterium]
MKRPSLDEETFLELGLVVFATGLLTGIATLLYGRAAGTVRHQRGHRQSPPAAGIIPAEQHNNISTTAAR